jgi:hypothetical protein
MRNLQHVAAVLALSVSVGCGDEKGADVMAPQLDVAEAEPASGPSASGHGNWTNAAGEGVSRSFHGREKDGVVTGVFVQWVTAVTGVRRKNVGDIDCLRLIAPNDAVLSGPIKENANPLLIGQTQIFRVYDDGEGSDAVDRQSGLTFRAAASGVNCQNFTPPDASVTAIRSGNIQVRP